MAPDRRDFLQQLGAALLLASAGCRSSRPPVTGAWLGPDHAFGHRLRDGRFPAPTRRQRTRVAIVGGGIAGLTAAWALRRAGLEDFRVFELEAEPGGNARGGASRGQHYPWGAHYLPLPTAEAGSLLTLLEELGVVTGRAADGSPRYDERYLLAPPAERLFQHGRWRDGLRPLATGSGQAQFQAFEQRIASYASALGIDGRPAFTTPSDRASRDPRYTALDRLSMAQWMREAGLNDPALRWWVEYGCRDDFGTRLEQTSAWAGLHYFAGRRIWGPYEPGQLLTWPQGNAWIVERLRAGIGDRLLCRRMAVDVQASEHDVTVQVWDGQTTEAWQAERLILCVPDPIRDRLLGEARLAAPRPRHPWLVANLHVRREPAGSGVGLAWDNVLHDSPGLGYISAAQQQLGQAPTASVLTYYLPFPDGGLAARRLLLETSWQHWVDFILADLRRAHPDIDECVEQVDLWPWGHGMAAPVPGSLFSGTLDQARKPRGRIHFAHSDLSGFSLFEEAHYWAEQAATQVLAAL